MNYQLLITLIPVFPLLGFLVIALGGKQFGKSAAGMIGSGSVLASFILALITFFGVKNSPDGFLVPVFEWISSGTFNAPFAFLIDPLSALFLLIITGIGFLIHIYSAGYMHDDPAFNRFFSYLNLFIFFMLLLVMGDNYLVMFVGWEGVGLCSYLLIGFWFKNQDYNKAANKAFIMNRVGDLGFILGILLIFMAFGSVRYNEVFAMAASYPTGTTVMIGITLLLFVGATGKSAQIPLFTWLPDAMAGPTPVSALIHAATMVTAGIYMIARSNILFVLAPVSMDIIAGVGLVTAVFAASIALYQNDIKKVLAYSTVSQLGYMFLGLGVGAFTGAVFHVMTHAFFKALLFLGAGSVIHAMGGEQDMRSMGGLKKKLPVTYLTFLIATIAIAGIPPFSGFFSKDEILAHAFAYNKFFWVVGLLGSLMTSFYMFRLFYLTFYGEFRGTHHQKEHLHESPSSMTIPLIILAALSFLGGFAGMPEVLGGGHALGHFLEPVFKDGAHKLFTKHLDHSTEYILMGVTTVSVIITIYMAYLNFVKKKTIPPSDDKLIGAVQVTLYNKYYVDEVYDALFRRPVDFLSGILHRIVELKVIDQLVNNIGRWIQQLSGVLRLAQTGSTGLYIFIMALGLILILLFRL